MFFKGTSKRCQKDIACEIDILGGDLNAFTSKETTTFYIKVLDEYLAKGLDLLTDIFMNSTFPKEEIEKEKKVIMEEIRLSEDTPDELIHDIFSEFVWGGQGLGQRILGSPDTVNNISREKLLKYIDKHYTYKKIIISCAGNVDIENMEVILKDTIGKINRSSANTNIERQKFNYGVNVVERDLAEVHLCIGVEGIAQNNPARYAMLLINTIMGASISSRLFQKLREEKALAYSVYSFVSSYQDSGIFGVYIGTSPTKVEQAIEYIKKELLNFSNTVKEEELLRAKRQLKGNLMLSLESSFARMSNIARQEIYYGKYYSPQEIINAIEKVTLKDIKNLSEYLFYKKQFATVAIGAIDFNKIN